MKVRVPKEHRPPQRFGVFGLPSYDDGMEIRRFRVKGSYRRPKMGEWIYCHRFPDVPHAHCAQFDFKRSRPYVILERVA